MGSLRALLLFVLLIFAGGALLAPWLYHATGWLATHFSAFSSLSEKPFYRFVNRSFILLAILGLWPFLNAIRVRCLQDLGFVGKPRKKELLGGFLVGFFSLGIVAALLLTVRVRAWDSSKDQVELLVAMATNLLAASAIALLEETLFRGALMRAFKLNTSWIWALIASSFAYALVHFFAKAPWSGPVEWDSGWVLLPRMMRGFANLDMLFPSFINLFLVGCILGYAYQKTGSLYLSISLHAGWIFWLKSFSVLTERGPTKVHWLWGTSKMTDGILTTLVLTLILAAGIKWFKRKDVIQTTVPMEKIPTLG